MSFRLNGFFSLEPLDHVRDVLLRTAGKVVSIAVPTMPSKSSRGYRDYLLFDALPNSNKSLGTACTSVSLSCRIFHICERWIWEKQEDRRAQLTRSPPFFLRFCSSTATNNDQRSRRNRTERAQQPIRIEASCYRHLKTLRYHETAGIDDDESTLKLIGVVERTCLRDRSITRHDHQ